MVREIDRLQRLVKYEQTPGEDKSRQLPRDPFMRMHYSQQVTTLIRSLGQEEAALRRVLESVKANSVPEWANPLPDRVGGYEWLVEGYWIM